MSAKPIVVMYIPEQGYVNNGAMVDGAEAANHFMRALNGNFGQEPDESGVSYPDYWKDYYWLVFAKRDIEEPQLEVFYEKDFTPIKFEELKKYIEDVLAERHKESTVQG